MKDIKNTVYVESKIQKVRGQRVIIDVDLAELYGVPTKRLNEQVKRNPERFPQDFMFQLTPAEVTYLKSQNATSSSDPQTMNRSQIATGSQKHRDPRYLPFAFTEHGAIMAANVLNSPQAVEMSVFVVRAFVKMREYLGLTQAMEKRLAEIEKKLLLHDASLRDLYERIRPLLLPPPDPPKRRIGFKAEERKAKYNHRVKMTGGKSRVEPPRALRAPRTAKEN
jgi:hypothetical protein